LPDLKTIGAAGECCPSLLGMLRAAIMDGARQHGRRESDPSAMLGLVVLVVMGLLVAIAIGGMLGLFLR
jgi:hypothetical protein